MQPVPRRATARDATAIADLVTSAYRHYEPLIGRTPLPMLADYAKAVRDHEIWVLDGPAGVIGVLELERRQDHLWIENVAIAPEHQGEGLGRLLLEYAEGEARRMGLDEIGLLTNERYAANIAMYTRYGYRETHRVPHRGTDLVYFRKRLVGAVNAPSGR